MYRNFPVYCIQSINNFAPIVSDLRTSARMDQSTLAKDIHCDRSVISKLEKNTQHGFETFNGALQFMGYTLVVIPKKWIDFSQNLNPTYDELATLVICASKYLHQHASQEITDKIIREIMPTK